MLCFRGDDIELNILSESFRIYKTGICRLTNSIIQLYLSKSFSSSQGKLLMICKRNNNDNCNCMLLRVGSFK